MNKKIIGRIVVLTLTLAFALSIHIHTNNHGLPDTQISNVEALAQNKTGDEWYKGFVTESVEVVSGHVIPCCVPSAYDSNACDFNATGCIKLI